MERSMGGEEKIRWETKKRKKKSLKDEIGREKNRL